MMKCEFEELIGKEVSYETFEMYESMYSALPENISKVDFVNMLNIKAIPESEYAIRRREEKERFISDIKDEIAGKRADIKFFKQANERYRIMLKDEDCSEMRDIIRRWIKANNRHICNLKIAVEELSWVVEQ